jgi:RHS repeat-associated protein
VTAIRENGATSGIGVLATIAYDNLGRRTSLALGNGVATTYSYDPLSRLDELKLEFAGTNDDLTSDFAYNPASQIASTTRSNDAYAWTGHGSGTMSTTSNGLNQIAGWVGSLGYDAKGNITGDGTYSYGYSSENLLTSLANTASGAVQTSSTYAYDPLMRLAVINSTNDALDASLGYDGQDFIYEGLSGGRTRRYVRGPGVDEPLVAYLVTGTGTSRLWYQADERGSITRLSNDSGTPGLIGKYDEYGVGGTGRIRYAGQYWLADGSLIYSRARIYDARLGRFLQPDPIGYGDGMNMYGYVGGDPVNFTDPTGTCGSGEVSMAFDRTSRGEGEPGDVVALYRFFCVRLYVGGNGNGSPGVRVGDTDGGTDVCAPGDPSCEVTITGERPVRDLRQCEADFAGQQFTLEMSWDLRNVQFRYGRDNNTNDFSHMALDEESSGAVTQGPVIYVKPSSWKRITNPNNSAFWEEIFHTTQFSKLQELFYMRYFAASAGAWARGESIYWGNSLEREAKRWADVLAQRFRRTKPCAN